MTSVIMSGTFNALAFAGAGYLFKVLDKNGYEKEMERHNRAMENLTRDKEKLYEEQVKKNNRLAKLRQEVADADAFNMGTLKALHNYRTVKEQLDEMREPALSDYYKPSEKMSGYMELFKITMASGSGWLLSKLVM